MFTFLSQQCLGSSHRMFTLMRESPHSEVLLEFDDQLPLVLGDFLAVVFLEAVDGPAGDEGDELGAVLELLPGLDAGVAPDGDRHAPGGLPGLLQLLVVVLDRLHVPHLHLSRLLPVLRVLLPVDHQWGSDLEDSVLDVYSEYDGIALAEDGDGLEYAGEDCLLALLGLPFLPHLVHVLGEEVSQVVDDIGCEDLDLVFLCVFLGICQYLHVEYQKAPVSALGIDYSFFLRSGISESMDFMAFITSSLETGPTVTYETGTFSFARYSNSASSDPKVDAATPTPTFSSLIFFFTFQNSFSTMALASSISSSEFATMRGVPATALSSPLAAILTPLAPQISLWWRYSSLMRISFMGWGVRMALILVTMGPSNPRMTMVSSFFTRPSTNMQSMVVPYPSIIFTSITVHLKTFSLTRMRLLILGSVVEYLTITESRSGMPSPVMPEVGTRLMQSLVSSFSQQRAALQPLVLSSRMILRNLSSQSRRASLDCCLRVRKEEPSLMGFQSQERSILFSATTKGVFRFERSSRDYRVWFYRPCCRSITRMAMSHREDPRDRRLLKLSWPGVSMISSPGTFTSTSQKLLHLPTSERSLSWGKKVAPICCVMPPASPSCTLVCLILSSRVVFPVSTWPRMQQTGLRNSPILRAKQAWSSLRSRDSSFFCFYSMCWISSSVGSSTSSISPRSARSACCLAFSSC